LCEVCGEPITDTSKLPPEIQDKVYRPRDHEQYNVEVVVEKPKRMNRDDDEEVEITEQNGKLKADLGKIELERDERPY